jgi:uncharacterized protein (TIGR00375 family)
MNTYFVDLHVHIGRTYKGRAVKITGSKNLTLENILTYSNEPKGLDVIGIIDCHSPEVIEEIENLIEAGEIEELEKGGFQHRDGTVLIPGSEIELYNADSQGPIHVLAYFPSLHKLKTFSSWLSQHVTNIHLSTQRIYCSSIMLQQKVKELKGLFIAAHVFTPFKSLYGKGVKNSLTEVLDPELIDGIELGLSANTEMASGIEELKQYSFVTNSDAHSLQKMAREYQAVEMEQPNFSEIKLALKGKYGRKIKTNYGLNPLLGKYYDTTCKDCGGKLENDEKICGLCGSHKTIRGVRHRIKELSGSKEKVKRPPYIPQVPLEYIGGLGPKTMTKLLARFKTEMNILHHVTIEELKETLPEKLAENIIRARNGELLIEAGGGGKYGKVK